MPCLSNPLFFVLKNKKGRYPFAPYALAKGGGGGRRLKKTPFLKKNGLIFLVFLLKG